jgi:diaminohydroxyphosphoribosylaminopyrimidine deaminase/5-amino-6-(5-phosphoribosylamino)uracil reductase
LALNERDIGHLERAISLAEQGRGCTSPNPLVGAVIVRGDDILGEGFHAGPGKDHAELAALKDAVGSDFAGRLVGATVYVTLEPCCHYGRTPPCTAALIAAGVDRVVAGVIDPSPAINGRGLDGLREAGIQVDLADGELLHRLKRQNDAFRKSVTTGLPFVTYKYAMTLDGRVAADSGDSRWISSRESRLLVHRLRAESDAVLIGAGTLRRDDPRLTAREVHCARQPLRVAVDSGLSVRADAALVTTRGEGGVLVICAAGTSEARQAEVRSWGVDVATITAGEGGHPDPIEVARYLAGWGVQSVMLEGGPTLAGAWWRAGLVDKVLAFISPQLVSGRICRSPLMGEGSPYMAEAAQLRECATVASGRDVLITGYLGEPF